MPEPSTTKQLRVALTLAIVFSGSVLLGLGFGETAAKDAFEDVLFVIMGLSGVGLFWLILRGDRQRS